MAAWAGGRTASYLASDSARKRARIVGLALLAVLLAVAALLVALSFESIRSVFEIRASLEQSYDLGVTGRFGSQLRSIPLLLDEPNGFGPLRFRWLVQLNVGVTQANVRECEPFVASQSLMKRSRRFDPDE